jgi:TraM recognition site of TraD and TraG
MSWLAYHDLDRPIIPIDLRRDDAVIAYNVLRKRTKADPAVVIDSIVDAVAHVWGAQNTDATPRLARWIANIARALYDRGCTLVEAQHLIGDDPELRRLLTDGVTDPMTDRDWKRVATMKPKEFEDEISSSLSRLRRFVTTSRLRLMFGQSDASLDLRSVLDSGSIVLVSLARQHGNISKENADLFATLLMSDLWIAAQERGKSNANRPFYVYIDEFQRFLTPTIAENLDEARGFGLHLTLAHQFPNQLKNAGETGRRVFDSVMENARSKVVFSLSSRENLEPMAEWLYMGVIDPAQVKLAIHSTKVVGYREEARSTTSSGTTRSSGGTAHQGTTAGVGEGAAQLFQFEAVDPFNNTENKSQYEAESTGNTDSWSNSESTVTSESTMLVPIMGQELSSVQYRSIEEQLHLAMAALFDQEQRQCVVRLRGMRAPLTVTVPMVIQPHVSEDALESYIQRLLGKLPFVVSMTEANDRIEERTRLLVQSVTTAAKAAAAEPTSYARRISAPRGKLE